VISDDDDDDDNDDDDDDDDDDNNNNNNFEFALYNSWDYLPHAGHMPIVQTTN
jgi:hypothetical protein